jgi:hypothetical protein
MNSMDNLRGAHVWPTLPLQEWKSTCDTLHMWTQIVGKVRMALSPRVNHWWEVPLYVSSRGLTTSPIPYNAGVFEIGFDFIDHSLVIQTSGGTVKVLRLAPRTVADFYQELMAMLRSLGIRVKIWTTPVEIPDPIPFDQDQVHASYDPKYANRFWQILVLSDTVFKEFRARFIGKCSPVHFFWGSFDLAATRFSGRRAPERKGADPITREAYSHEVVSAGFWPGSGEITAPAFYSYTAPEPPGLSRQPIRPDTAFYSSKLSEFLLMYDHVRQAPSPGATLLEFLQTTYEAGANLAGWDRKELERSLVGSAAS